MSRIEYLIDMIDDSCKALMGYDLAEFNIFSNKIIKELLLILPNIISIYSDESMKNYASDAVYWPSQVQRVIDVLNGKDAIEMFDVLYNETRENLINLKNLLELQGINN